MVPDHADPAGRLIVSSLSLTNFRSYARLELALEPGVVLVAGPNGAGKTNLLESLHVGTQGFSPRTRVDAQLIRFGEAASRVAVSGRRGATPLEVEVRVQAGEGKRGWLNRTPLRSAEQLRSEVATLVFTPERLTIVKGSPGVRRAYFDRSLGRLAPAQARLPLEYGAALSQRNEALRRVAAGSSSRAALAPWTERVADLGARLARARADLLALLSEPFGEQAGELGLPDCRLVLRAEPPTVEALDARLERDLERGSTGLGPHLDDIGILSGSRDLRSFGSQGEQRTAVLALLLAEGELLRRRGTPPLLLLDDVLSELDPGRRRLLAERLDRQGQTIVTAAAAEALPVVPDQLVAVEPGRARSAT